MAAALALLALAAVAAAVYVARYRPLVEGDSFTPGPSGRLQFDAFVDRASYYRYRYRDGARTWFELPVRNAGRIPVTVTGVERDPPHWKGLLVITGARTRLPFHLAGGQERRLVVAGRFANCEWYAPHTSVTMSAIGVRYRVLGLSKTMSLPLRQRLTVPAPPRCPRKRHV